MERRWIVPNPSESKLFLFLQNIRSPQIFHFGKGSPAHEHQPKKPKLESRNSPKQRAFGFGTESKFLMKKFRDRYLFNFHRAKDFAAEVRRNAIWYLYRPEISLRINSEFTTCY